MSRNAAVGAALAEAPFELDLELVPVTPFRAEIPSEEFRTLRTRLEQLQATRTIQTVLVASPSPGRWQIVYCRQSCPGRGATGRQPNVALRFRPPRPHSPQRFSDRPRSRTQRLFAREGRSSWAMRRIGNSNLFVMPAGQAVINPLELLHLKEVRRLMDRLRKEISPDSSGQPSAAGASDANLLAGLADGALLVARIGFTTEDSMSRAIESLGADSILGIVANGTSPIAPQPIVSLCGSRPTVAPQAHWFTHPNIS